MKPVSITAMALACLLGAAQVALANQITPISSRDWQQDQLVQYRWKADSVPPDWMQRAINGAAADSNRSRRSKAARLGQRDGSDSWVAYAAELPTTAAIAYASRNAPETFKVWLRTHGHVFDWGVLRWCQFFDSAPNGCFDARTAALHEFGHVQGLGHTSVGPPDSIMYTTSLQKPKAGYDQRDFGACDVAALQTRYELLTASTAVSTCLSLGTSLSFAASATSFVTGGSVTFTAGLKIADGVAHTRLAGDPLSGRTVLLQRRPVGGTTWTTHGQMQTAAAEGSYRLAVSPDGTYEWRAFFAAPANEGLKGSGSAVIRVTRQTGSGSCQSGCVS
ncbi:MAG TPA: matrixin family metalloprotease [Candidatus Limnocylindrales bacterium]|nr:matrixin family metalloprotease [Candidatus Limnocylindrales bacterium]